MIYTTIRLLRDCDACEDRLEHLIKELKSREIDTRKKIPFDVALEVSGIENVVWGLQASKPTKDAEYIARKFAIECARHVVHIYEREHPDDNRPRKCIEAAEAYFLRGEISRGDFEAAWDAAGAAARAAGGAGGAARAAWAAWAAGGAGAAVRAARAARDAVGAARAAAGAAELKWQEEKLKEIVKEYYGG